MGSSYSDYIFLYMNGELAPRYEHFLEHNDNFMRTVMLSGYSSKFYDKCSKDIKNDGDFLKELGPIFINDHEFLINMVTEFCSNNPRNHKDIVELNLLLDDLYDKTGDDVFYPAHAEGERFYQNIMSKVNEEILKMKSAKEKKNAGFGFIMVDVCFPGSDIVKRFTAKKMTEEILLYNPIHPTLDFEELVHSYYGIAGDVNNIADRKFLFDILKDYDLALRDYLGVHPDILDPYVELVKGYVKNWDSYLDNLNRFKLEKTYDEMDRYICDNNLPSTYMDMFRGIVDLSHHRTKISKYLDDDKDYEKIDLNNLDINEYKFVSHMRDYMNKMFGRDVMIPDDEFENEEEMEEKEDSKVLKIDFVNKRRMD